MLCFIFVTSFGLRIGFYVFVPVMIMLKLNGPIVALTEVVKVNCAVTCVARAIFVPVQFHVKVRHVDIPFVSIDRVSAVLPILVIKTFIVVCVPGTMFPQFMLVGDTDTPTPSIVPVFGTLVDVIRELVAIAIDIAITASIINVLVIFFVFNHLYFLSTTGDLLEFMYATSAICIKNSVLCSGVLHTKLTIEIIRAPA